MVVGGLGRPDDGEVVLTGSSCQWRNGRRHTGEAERHEAVGEREGSKFPFLLNKAKH
jgi:hypothetical protein